MRGARRRARMAFKQFEALLKATDEMNLKGVDLVGMADHVRNNTRLTLDELKTDQAIEESRHRLATDEQFLQFMRDEVVANNFVRRTEERERVLGVLVSLRFPFALQLADLLYPPVRNVDTAEDILATYDRLKSSSASGTIK